MAEFGFMTVAAAIVIWQIVHHSKSNQNKEGMIDESYKKMIDDLKEKQDLFYNILEEKSGFKIDGDHQLLNLVTKLSRVKNEYDKIESALFDAKNKGYGVVAPSLDELSLEEPEIIKQGKQYGIKLRANAPSLHIIKADISTEVSPIVGNQSQGEEMIKYLLETFEENPSELWSSNMFGKSLNDLVKEQLQSKLYTMPEEIRVKIQKTLQKIKFM